MKIIETGKKYGIETTMDVYAIEFHPKGRISYLTNNNSKPQLCNMLYTHKSDQSIIDILDNTLTDFRYIEMKYASIEKLPVVAHQIIAEDQYLYFMLVDPYMWEYATDEDRAKVPQFMLKKGYNPLHDFLARLEKFNTKID